MDFTNPDVLNELLQLEFGTNFVLPSGSEGSSMLDTDTAADADADAETITPADTGRSDPGKTYVSKEDAINEMKESKTAAPTAAE